MRTETKKKNQYVAIAGVLLKCRYINLTERTQNIITVSQLYAAIHIFKVALV